MTLDLYGINARCLKCECVFTWHLSNAPFVDSEIVGTCDDCRNNKEHDCVDERYEPFKIIKNREKIKK